MDQTDDQKVVQSSEAVKSKEGSCKTSGSPCVPAKREQIFTAPQESGQSPEPTAASVEPEQPLKRELLDAGKPVPPVADAKLSAVGEELNAQSADKNSNNNREVGLLQPPNNSAPERTSNGDSEEGEEDDDCYDDELEYPVSRPKRSRTAYSAYQLDQLEWVFSQTHYPDVLIRQELSTRLGIAETKLQIWFQNRRARWRKQRRTGCVSSRSRNRKRQGTASTAVSSLPMGMALPQVSPWMLQATNIHGSSNGAAVGGESNTPGFFYNITNTGTVTQCSPLPLASTAIPTVLPSIASFSEPANSSMPYTPQGVVPTPPLPPAPGQLPPGYHPLLPMPVVTLPSQALNEATPLYTSFQTVEH